MTAGELAVRPRAPDEAPGEGVAMITGGWPRRITFGVLFLLLLVLAFGVGRNTAPTPPPPADTSADVGFARDMQAHHAQAVEMSLLVRDRTTDPEVRLLAYDFALTQQHQIGQMFGWLVQWNLPQDGPVMAWMHAPGAAGSAHHGNNGIETSAGTESAAAASARGEAVPDSAMPGMATAAEMRRLGQLKGRDAEILYLQLMIAHHRGGVEMADALLDRAPRPEVGRLAQAMVTGQTSEIATMQGMLRARGAD